MSQTNVRSERKAIAIKTAIVAASLFIVVNSNAATLTPGTLRAWNSYVRKVEQDLPQDGVNNPAFFWYEMHSTALEAVQAGPGMSVHSPHGSGVSVPSGLVHHWIGRVFIPNASVAELLSVLQDYDEYSVIYGPGVVESKLLNRDGDEFTYRMKFVQKGLGVKAGLIGQFQSVYHVLTPGTGYSVTQSTGLSELAEPGTSNERAVPFSEAHGYVERVFTIVRYRHVNGGVYVEVEALTLSRGVPAAVHWVIGPLIERFSRHTMAETLERLRGRVQGTSTQEAARPDSIPVSGVPAQ